MAGCSYPTSKDWVTAVYQTETFNSLLQEALHPGGLALTRRLLEIASINKGSAVLDIACGKGGTAILLGQEFSCRVVGLDLSARQIAQARSQSEEASDKVEFIIADAEELPFAGSTFDTIISECAFSILPDKPAAAREMNRVLKPQGRLIITDITIKEGTPDDASGESGTTPEGDSLIPCIIGAKSVTEYVAILESAGFHTPYFEDHSAALKSIAYHVGLNFGSWAGFLRQLSAELLPGDADSRAEAEAKTCQALTQLRKFGYALLMLDKR